MRRGNHWKENKFGIPYFRLKLWKRNIRRVLAWNLSEKHPGEDNVTNMESFFFITQVAQVRFRGEHPFCVFVSRSILVSSFKETSVTLANWRWPFPKEPGTSGQSPWFYTSCSWEPLWDGRKSTKTWKKETWDKWSESRSPRVDCEFSFPKVNGSLRPMTWVFAGSNQDWVVRKCSKAVPLLLYTLSLSLVHTIPLTIAIPIPIYTCLLLLCIIHLVLLTHIAIIIIIICYFSPASVQKIPHLCRFALALRRKFGAVDSVRWRYPAGRHWRSHSLRWS